METSYEYDTNLVHIEISHDCRCLEIITEIQVPTTKKENYESEIIFVSFKINERNKKKIKQMAIDKYIEHFGDVFTEAYEGDYRESRISSNEF
jgi:chloramphenicol O-acetyltransferase